MIPSLRHPTFEAPRWKYAVRRDVRCRVALAWEAPLQRLIPRATSIRNNESFSLLKFRPGLSLANQGTSRWADQTRRTRFQDFRIPVPAYLPLYSDI